MGSSDNFCLRWNDFESNISSSFTEMRDDKEFFDVTLCCDEGNSQLQAHKIILAACSPFFRRILSRNNHQNPLIYLKGVDYANLAAVLNFMYHGEVNVAQDELSAFLKVAEELAVKGLTDNKKSNSSQPASEQPKKAIKRPPPLLQQSRTSNVTPSSIKKRKSEASVPSTMDKIDVKPDLDITPVLDESAGPSDGVFDESATAAEMDDDYGYDATLGAEGADYLVPEDGAATEDHITIDGALTETGDGGKDPSSAIHDEPFEITTATTVNDFIVRSDNLFWCNVCHFNTKQRIIMVRHVEAKHFTKGYDCEFCGQKLKTKQFLHRHKVKYHSQPQQQKSPSLRH